jgi:endo-1,3-1,4-beta-glycanase ExoK
MLLLSLLILLVQIVCAEQDLLGSAELYTNESVAYGRFEVRMRMVAADGVISSFFLWKDGSEKKDAIWNEIDIEVLGNSPGGFQSAIHYGSGGWPNMKHLEAFHQLKNELTSNYNTYTIEWTPDYISWKINDSLIRKDTGDMVKGFRNIHMQLRFNIWPSLQSSWAGLFNPETLPKHMYINWIKYYKHTPGNEPNFMLAWKENFDSDSINTRWLKGFWESPDKASTHIDKNVNVKNGVAILTLSKFPKCGYNGIIPQDNQGGTTFPKEFSRGR